jgi:hypothetical protein
MPCDRVDATHLSVGHLKQTNSLRYASPYLLLPNGVEKLRAELKIIARENYWLEIFFNELRLTRWKDARLTLRKGVR